MLPYLFFLFSITLIALSPFIFLGIYLYIGNAEYKKSTYYRDTQNSFLSVRFNKGRYGEFLTYKRLKSYETIGSKFLFNLYIPKGDNQTTEIDVLLITPKGVFVFESKNYSGWIFGDENKQKWVQTLPIGRGRSRKNYFYNPVKQNRTHIKHLKELINENADLKSVIVFSDRCTLKNITLTSNNVVVINRYNIFPAVSAIYNSIPTITLSTNEINDIYNNLYPYSQVSNETKTQHITNIQSNILTAQPIIQSIKETTTEIECTVTTENNSNDICPKCGSKLVLRTAKQGQNKGNQFYGCSNYPKCRYIKNINNN